MRHLATIQRIKSIDPIKDADAIEVVQVGGWRSVVKKGEFAPGDLVIYCEIDSWIPHEIAPFLSKGDERKEYLGVTGNRLKTIRLRGTLSQGLVLPTSLLGDMSFDEGDDVTEALGIQKWEAPVPAQLSGTVKGNFPSFVPKTDSERIQNLEWLFSVYPDVGFIGHEKLDGTSCTAYYHNGEFGVCSRNLDVKEDSTNAFWQVARAMQLEEGLKSLGGNWAVQMEIIGEGIQGNKYNIKGKKAYVFDIYDIDKNEYINTNHAKYLAGTLGIEWVPLVYESVMLEDYDLNGVLLLAEGKSALNPKVEREGVVFRPLGEITDDLKMSRVAFKAISNAFLLNEK